MGFFILFVEVCTVKVVYIQIFQSTAKTMFISRGAPLFLTDFVDYAGGDGLRLVYGDERSEIVNLKLVN